MVRGKWCFCAENEEIIDDKGFEMVDQVCLAFVGIGFVGILLLQAFVGKELTLIPALQ